MHFRARDPKEWTRWFAWRPILTTNLHWVWLETVECRYSHAWWRWQYRRLGDEE